MADISQIQLPNGTVLDIKDPVARAAASEAGIGGIFYGTCDTAAATQTKVVTIEDFELFTGVMIAIKFDNVNTATSPKININGEGAKNLYSVGATAVLPYAWKAGEVVMFAYNGTAFVMVEGGIASTTEYGVTKLNSSTSSTSTTEAATPSAVKSAYDLANIANTLALEAKTSASDGKTLIASAITGKGVSTSATDTYATMADNIDAIETGHTITLDGVEYDDDVNLTTSSVSWTQPSGVWYVYEYFKAQYGRSNVSSYFPANVILFDNKYYIFKKTSPYYTCYMDINTGAWSTFSLEYPTNYFGYMAFDGANIWCICKGGTITDGYFTQLLLYKYDFAGTWTLMKTINVSVTNSSSYSYCRYLYHVEFYNNCLFIKGIAYSSTSSGSTAYMAYAYDTVNDNGTYDLNYSYFSKFFSYNGNDYTWYSSGTNASNYFYIWRLGGSNPTNFTFTQVLKSNPGLYNSHSSSTVGQSQVGSYNLLFYNNTIYVANLYRSAMYVSIYTLSDDLTTLTFLEDTNNMDSYTTSYFYSIFMFRDKLTVMGCKHTLSKMITYSVTL